MVKTKNKAVQTSKEEKIKYSDFPLTKINFVLMGICGAMIVIGFLLMLGGSNELDHFNADIFSIRRIKVAPAVCFFGFIFMIYGIMHKPKK